MRRHVISFFLLLLCIGELAYFIHKGFAHTEPQNTLRWSKQNWVGRNYSTSVKLFILSYEEALNAGIRWTIVEIFYFPKFTELSNQKKLNEALEVCADTVKVLSGYDDEGALSYECTAIENEIEQQK